MESVFYYPVTLHRGTSAGEVIAASVDSLPIGQKNVDQVLILTSSEGKNDQGLYVWDGTRWRFALPLLEVCRALIEGDIIDVYYALTQDVTGISPLAHVYRNSLSYAGTTLASAFDVVWVVRQAITSNVGEVKSVNGNLPDAAGNVVLPAATSVLPGLVKIGSGISVTADGTISAANSYTLPPATASVLGGVKIGTGISVTADGTISAASSYVLPVATSSVLGGVKQGANVAIAGDGTISVAAPYSLPIATAAVLGGVKQGAGVTIAGDGTLSVPAAPVTSVSGQAGAVVIKAQDNNSATGNSLIVGDGSGTGVIRLKTIVAGSNIVLGTDASGNLVVSSSSSGSLTAVNSEGTGTSLVDNNGTTGGIAILKSLAAGSNVTITQAGDGKTLTIAANQVLNPATTTTIGGVIVKAGLAVDGLGNLSLAAPTGANLGGVKAGTGIAIDASGVISVTATGGVSSVSGQVGTVVVQASDTSTASGTSLISDSGATTANIKIKRLVAGSNITLAPDGNGNLQINSTLAATVTSFATGTSGQLHGDIVFAAGQAISLSNTGNTIQINGTGVPEAPNDGGLYGRQNMGWVAIPTTSNPIVAVNGQTGTGAVLLVEASPPANTAVIKSLVAGANITLSETGGLITVTAAIPGGTVATVNSKAPDGSGNVTLAAADVSALPISGGNMTGDINMATHKVTGLPTPVNPSDAVPYSLITGLVIDGGVIG